MNVYLGLGSNVRDRVGNLKKAVDELKQTKEIHITKLSSIYKSEPVDYKNQPWFFNAVIEAYSDLNPHDLLKLVKRIEKIIGRSETFKWGPRIIDIDILCFENKIIQTSTLIIPHPQMYKRKFVLIPLAEIAPFYIHPVKKISVGQMIKNCPDNQVECYSKFILV